MPVVAAPSHMGGNPLPFDENLRSAASKRHLEFAAPSHPPPGGFIPEWWARDIIGMREASNRSRVTTFPQAQRGTYLKPD